MFRSIVRPIARAGSAPLAALLLAVSVAAPASAQMSDDREGVRRASMDYLEGFYEGDTAKLARSIRTDVYKIGFSRSRNSATYGPQQQMTWPQFLDYALSVKASGRSRPATDPKEVQVLDVLDQTAATKITAWWGTDYLLLAKFDGKWMVTHVLWQSPVRG